jgi:hypothetical protein
VQDFEWTNPHCWLDVVSTGGADTGVKWALEAQSPSALTRKGWTKAKVKAGDKLTIAFFPSKDGGKSGAVRSITLADDSMLAAYGSVN